ncbi:unnamed protein product [Dibothriocephalus latus]|uniref:Uncharacterized protein n=1 Tax=Dibothriocephalus latus TaxID=60516 RepID=A0A3P7LGA8_DIBLA|nr:unnamed protein product [Dibothriocephalus latus]
MREVGIVFKFCPQLSLLSSLAPLQPLFVDDAGFFLIHMVLRRSLITVFAGFPSVFSSSSSYIDLLPYAVRQLLRPASQLLSRSIGNLNFCQCILP